MTRERHDLPVTGMTCAGCVASVERALVNLATIEPSPVAPQTGEHHAMPPVYFEAAAGILVLVRKPPVRSAHVVENGVEHERALEAIRVADVLAVREGETGPLDGIVVDGGSSVNESMLTGESRPVSKASGDGT